MRYGLILLVVLMGCAVTPPKAPAVQERVSGSYQPTGQDRAQLYQRTQAYWTARAARDWTNAYEFHTYDFRERMPFPIWRKQQVTLTGPRMVSIHWIKGAHRQFGPELYAIITWVDQVGQSGQLTWRQDGGGFFIEN